MMRTRTKQMWWCPPQATTSSELIVVCNWLPRLSEQSYAQSNEGLCKWSLSQNHDFHIHPSSSVTPRRRGMKTENFPNGLQGLKSLLCVTQEKCPKHILSFSAARNPEVESLETFYFWGKRQRGFGKMREAGKEEFPLLLIPVAALKSCSTFPSEECKNQTQNTQEETSHGYGLHGHN